MTKAVKIAAVVVTSVVTIAAGIVLGLWLVFYLGRIGIL